MQDHEVLNVTEAAAFLRVVPRLRASQASHSGAARLGWDGRKR